MGTASHRIFQDQERLSHPIPYSYVRPIPLRSSQSLLRLPWHHQANGQYKAIDEGSNNFAKIQIYTSLISIILTRFFITIYLTLQLFLLRYYTYFFLTQKSILLHILSSKIEEYEKKHSSICSIMSSSNTGIYQITH